MNYELLSMSLGLWLLYEPVIVESCIYICIEIEEFPTLVESVAWVKLRGERYSRHYQLHEASSYPHSACDLWLIYSACCIEDCVLCWRISYIADRYKPVYDWQWYIADRCMTEIDILQTDISLCMTDSDIFCIYWYICYKIALYSPWQRL